MRNRIKYNEIKLIHILEHENNGKKSEENFLAVLAEVIISNNKLVVF